MAALRPEGLIERQGGDAFGGGGLQAPQIELGGQLRIEQAGQALSSSRPLLAPDHQLRR
jgi:hypothetical protein